ncbi:MAG: hypothetical protein PHI59_07720, partial [Candidatus Omnitrophica bacterium]|nr:hypothetical protein [Candidatus Omnitrophota bacterium]
NHRQWSDAEKAYQWLVPGQRTNSIFLLIQPGLVPSSEKNEDCFTYDEALAAMAFTHKGDYKRARLLFDFFDNVRNKHIKESGAFLGFTDVYKRNGKETETRAAGPNAWVLMALNYYYAKTADPAYLPLARDIADWLISLQSIEGGIIGGYYGNGKPMTWISAEHNFDCYAAFRDLGILASEEKYLKAAKDVKKWLDDDAWDKKFNRFFMGRNNKNFATDLSSWAVLSLGNDYAKSIAFAIEKSQNTQVYKIKNVKVEGFDFGSTYNTSPFPDKDAVWFEGTAHMILAFDKAGMKKERDYFMNELDRCLTNSPSFSYTAGLPYASNEGTPVYDSWRMQDKPLCISSTAWYYFAKNSFNPFSALEDINSSNKKINGLKYEPVYQFVPLVDDFEYNDIKFHTAYTDELMQLNKSAVDLKWTNELAFDGSHSMKIVFTPDKNAKTASATIRRQFLYPQDWSSYGKLTVEIYSNGTSGRTNNIANLSVRDGEGESYDSGPMFLNRSGWTKYAFDLTKDFSRNSYDGVTYGDNIFGISKIIEISFTIKSKHPVENCTVYLDRIELEK